MATVSNSNTKAQILKAYEELLTELKASRKENTALQQEIEQKRKLVEKAKQATAEDATLPLKQLRSSINQQLDELEEALDSEQDKLKSIQDAIAIEKERLEEHYKLKTQAESLDALLITSKQKKEDLEEQYKQRKADLEAEIQETRLKWKREEEEFEYNLKISRKKEANDYEEKQVKLERELQEQKETFDKNFADREQAIIEKEGELVALQNQVESFEERLAKVVVEAEKQLQKQLSQEFEYQKLLENKDLQSELRLKDQIIENLKAKVEDQEKLIASLTGKVDNANDQVKDIALKAIENSSLRNITLSSERGKDDRNSDK